MNAPIGIDYTDLRAVADQLDLLSGNSIDVILETPGGLAERAEDIVRMLRSKFENVGFIVPGAAMSAGTIMVMSGDEILLEPNSSLGPIDAQVFAAGKRLISIARTFQYYRASHPERFKHLRTRRGSRRSWSRSGWRNGKSVRGKHTARRESPLPKQRKRNALRRSRANCVSTVVGLHTANLSKWTTCSKSV